MKIVNVSAPAINYVFNSSGKITPQDFSSPIWNGGFLQSRIFSGEPGTPAAGLHAYLYRIDLRNVADPTQIRFITSLKLDFGAVIGTIDFNGDHIADQVFVITKGGLGNVAPSSATESGSILTFVFTPSVGSGSAPGNGDSSYFFGLLSEYPPHTITATATNTAGPDLSLSVYAPHHP